MTSCPACQEIAFENNRCSSCGYEEVQILELELDAIIDDAEPLSVDALTLIAPEEMLSTGGPEPLELEPLDGLETFQLEGADDGEPIPMMEGLEGTMIEERAPRPKKAESGRKRAAAPFVHKVCPQCEAPVAEPNPPFCEACGFKLVAKKKKAEAAGAAPAKICGDCGSSNTPDRSHCRSCGARLKSLEV